MTKLDDLFSNVVESMRAYLVAADDERTAVLRSIAGGLVDARGFFVDKDGNQDWSGRTYGYRMWVRDATATANVPAGDRSRLQAAVRWHVGTVLRARLTSDELTGAGLMVDAFSARTKERRAEANETRRLIGPGPAIETATDLISLADLFDVTLRRLPDGFGDGFTGAERRAVAAAFAPARELLANAFGGSD